MPTEKSSAVVLRLVPFSDTSLVVTLYTRGMGKIGALAKGARRPKSSFESALDLLAVCRVVFIHKSSEALDLLTEAKLERRFRSAARDLSRLYAGFYLAEILAGLTEFADPHPALYDATERTLRSLDEGGDIARWLTWYQLRLLDETGQLPALDRCARCGTDRIESSEIRLGLVDGGLLCGRCRAGRPHVVRLLPASWQALRALARAEDPAGGVDLPGDIPIVVGRYITHVLGRPPRTARFLESVAGRRRP